MGREDALIFSEYPETRTDALEYVMEDMIFLCVLCVLCGE